MMAFYSELSEYDAVEVNLPRELKKKVEITTPREVLTSEQRKTVKEKLISKHYRFYLFMQIFFHSGSRIKEFSRLQLKDIDLERKVVKMLVMKRRKPAYVIKPIKLIALPYWQEYLKGYDNPNLFFLGEGLQPAEKPIRSDQITKRWKRLVKNDKELGVVADFYALKHLNSDEVSEAVGIERAAKLNGHTSTNTTKIYAIGESTREMDIIRRVNNAL